MMKRLALFCCLLFALVLPAMAGQTRGNDVDRLISSRRVLGSVQFGVGSAFLDPQARASLDRIADELVQVDPQRVLVRIEGFASPEGVDRLNLPVSVMRAKAVEDYLRTRHEFKMEFFLIGLVDKTARGLSNEQRRRAEVALYDNIWELEEVPVDNTILNW